MGKTGSRQLACWRNYAHLGGDVSRGRGDSARGARRLPRLRCAPIARDCVHQRAGAVPRATEPVGRDRRARAASRTTNLTPCQSRTFAFKKRAGTGSAPTMDCDAHRSRRAARERRRRARLPARRLPTAWTVAGGRTARTAGGVRGRIERAQKYRERGFASEDRAAPVTATVPVRGELGFSYDASPPRKAPRRIEDRAPPGAVPTVNRPQISVSVSFSSASSIFCDIFLQSRFRARNVTNCLFARRTAHRVVVEISKVSEKARAFFPLGPSLVRARRRP